MKERRALPLVVGSLLILFTFTSTAFSACTGTMDGHGKEIRLGYSETLQPHALCISKTIYEEVYSKLGYSLSLVPLPPAQEAHQIEALALDGALIRSESFSETHPDIVRIEATSTLFSYSLYAVADSKISNLYEAMNDPSITIAYVIGMSFATDFLNRIDKDRLVGTHSNKASLSMLVEGRVDLAVIESSSYNHLIAENDLYTHKRIDLKQVYISNPVTAHTYLHKRHEDLALKVGKEVRAMKISGRIEEIVGQCHKQDSAHPH